MEILSFIVANVIMLILLYISTIIDPHCFHFNSISIYENQMIKEKSVLNIVYFKKNTIRDPRLKSVALGMIIATILSFFGNITIGILYFTNVFEYNILKSIAITHFMFVICIAGFSGMHLLAKDWIYAKREKKMSEEEIENIRLRILQEVPTFFDMLE